MQSDGNIHDGGGESEPPWEQLFATADAVVRSTIHSLPEDLRSKAEKLPCLYEKWPDEDLAEDTLGTCSGFEPGQLSEQNGPIILFLGPIYQLCCEENADFENEIRTTFLHEFGHFLGWDEQDLEQRGLL